MALLCVEDSSRSPSCLREFEVELMPLAGMSFTQILDCMPHVETVLQAGAASRLLSEPQHLSLACIAVCVGHCWGGGQPTQQLTWAHHLLHSF